MSDEEIERALENVACTSPEVLQRLPPWIKVLSGVVSSAVEGKLVILNWRAGDEVKSRRGWLLSADDDFVVLKADQEIHQIPRDRVISMKSWREEP